MQNKKQLRIIEINAIKIITVNSRNNCVLRMSIR